MTQPPLDVATVEAQAAVPAPVDPWHIIIRHGQEHPAQLPEPVTFDVWLVLAPPRVPHERTH